MSRPAIVRHHRDLGVVAAPLLILALLTGAMLVFRPIAGLILGPSAPARIETSPEGTALSSRAAQPAP